MMLTFGNRWIAISKLIRQMHSDLVNSKKPNKSGEKYITQIVILNLRLKYVKYMQLFSGLAFILNLLSILVGIFNSFMAPYIFVLALILFSFALAIFIVEIIISSKALKAHLEDIGEKKNKNSF